jgi:hypothetical protein
MKYTIQLCLGWLCLALSYAYAQTENSVVVSENQQLTLTDTIFVSVECHLAVNPTNPKHFLVSSITSDTKIYTTTNLVSLDGGQTWKASLSHLPEAADPVGLILPNGTVISADICGGDEYLLALRQSQNGGLTWSKDTISFGAGFDHDMLVYNPIRKETYLIATQSLQKEQTDTPILIARSTNDGKTFPHRKLAYPFKNVDLNAKTPIIFSDGSLAIPLLLRGQYLVGEKKATPFAPYSNWLIISKDGGESFSSPLFISDLSGRRHNILAINQAQAFKDHLYYVFSTYNKHGILFCKSESKGESWTKPIRIDQNPHPEAWNELGAVAVSQQGIIGVIYSEQVEANKKCYQVYFTYSKDGGKTFEKPVKINASLSCPDASNGWIAEAWFQGGDYYGLVSLPNGSFRAVWSDARTAKFQLYTSQIFIK